MDTRALYSISYGLYVVSSVMNSKYNGQIANTVFQITSEPPTIAVSINKGNYTHEFIENSKILSVSVLSTDATMEFIGRFGFKSGRDFDKFEGINFKVSESGCPIVLDNSIAYLEAKIIDSLDVKTHTIYIAEIIDAQLIGKGEPMTYAYYHQVKKGKAPKAAPTYIKDIKEQTSDELAINKELVGSENLAKSANNNEEVKKMNKYECQVCGWIYDPEQGDPDGGIEPGTPFEALPDNWVCPVCGASKDEFKKI